MGSLLLVLDLFPSALILPPHSAFIMAFAMLQFTTGNGLPDLICLQLMGIEQQSTHLHTNSNAAEAINMHFA